MITYDEKERSFYLHTKNSTYLMQVNEQDHLTHLYYGSRIETLHNIDDIKLRFEFQPGSSTAYDSTSKNYSLNHSLLEVSAFGKGDYREPTLHVELNNGSRTIDFKYRTHGIIKNRVIAGMPQVRKTRTLCIELCDETAGLTLYLYYSVFEDLDIIVRNLELVNTGETIVLDKILSFNLDMPNQDYRLIKLPGAWIRERHVDTVTPVRGTIRIDSKKGVSGSDHNPFLLLKGKDTTEDNGKAYGFALVYSGNFEANVEISPHDLLRINMGINSFDFRYPLEKNETFTVPEAILAYSGEGMNTLSQNFHALVNQYIVKENQQFKERPVLVNNWEATYFDFNQKKLLAIARKAKELGIELFCLDDGWFGKRNDDYTSLGDWYCNEKKLPGGIKGLAEKINRIGLDFGIWVEPEMVSEDSDLYREHPEWAVRVPGREPSLGRNQLILDLTRPDVLEFLKNQLHQLFSSANITYVKWDMNRNFSDVFSSHLACRDQGKFNHLYVLGLYEILAYLTDEFPDILFESCSSGGNRFDLGMLYYMPQTWTSDNTDAFERLLIQEGTSLAYPLSSISNHVSSDRSHQVLRHTPLETRFNVACFGVLGYELDLSALTPYEEKVIKKQVAFYKTHRRLFQFGRFIRLKSVKDSNYTVWLVVNEEKTQGILGFFQKRALPNPGFNTVCIRDLDREKQYRITGREQYINIRTFGSLINQSTELPVKLKINHSLHNLIANRYLFKSDPFEKKMSGRQLENAELLLHHTFTGTGHNENVMMLPDYGSRLFIINAE